MNKKKQHWILYLITITIITTIVVQLFWNYKNYEQNKQRVINEIQISLDNAVEVYYADVSKNSKITFLEFPQDKESTEIVKNKKKDSTLKSIKSYSYKDLKEAHYKKNNYTSIVKKADLPKNVKNLNVLNNKIIVSFFQDSIHFDKLSSFLKTEFKRKNLSVPFNLKWYKENRSRNFLSQKKELKNPISILSKSTYLKQNEKLELLIKNPTLEALKRSSTGILLSLLLALAVISSLFYLLKIIAQQKELALIKSDLINNITHEFKTPITTISSAIEAIEKFNFINDKEKTKTYLSISNTQLEKLHQMVEKLLETATLDSENLYLKKEKNNVITLVKNQVKKHKLISKKSISFTTNKSDFFISIDRFHFENAISNLIDNAIKYGGNTIKVTINTTKKNIAILISDNGNGIEKSQQEKIFDKFYRIPKGNVHDVKGFGIGLYYTKKIIEKHNGTISVTSLQKNTTFTITLPND